MFPVRAVVVSIVLTLAVAPNAALLCSAWCHAQAATPSNCHHQKDASAPRVSANDCCVTVVMSVATFFREDVRRGVSAPDAGYSAFIPAFKLPRPRPLPAPA